MDPAPHKRKGPEAIIQAKIKAKLTLLGWLVMETHGTLYSCGFPDLYVTHYDYGGRWIECKNPLAYSFTPAQQKFFPLLTANGTKIWILTSDDDEEIKKFTKGPPNWTYYCKNHWM